MIRTGSQFIQLIRSGKVDKYLFIPQAFKAWKKKEQWPAKLSGTSDQFGCLSGEKCDFPSSGSTQPNNFCTEDWTSQKTWCQRKKKSRSGLCALDKHTCVLIKNCVCVFMYIHTYIHIHIHKKKNQSINYLVNRRKCRIITWSPSMHNVKKKKKTCNAFLLCLWVRLLKGKNQINSL